MLLMCFHLVVVGNGALTSKDFFVPQCSMRLMFLCQHQRQYFLSFVLAGIKD